MSQVHTWIKYLAFHSVISAHHAASSSSFVFWGCWLCLVDVIFPESLSDIALQRGLALRPKLNDTVWDRGQMVYVHQFSLSPSSIEKKNKVSETLWRVYFGNCKTLLIFRAGLHHRGIFILDGCSCSYSLSSSTAQLTLSKTLQSIDFSGFFFLQTHFFKLPIIQFFVGQQNKWSFSVSAGYIYTWITTFIFVCLWDSSRFLCALVYFFLKSLRCLKFSSKVLVVAPAQWRMTCTHCSIQKRMSWQLGTLVFFYTVFFHVPAPIVTSWHVTPIGSSTHDHGQRFWYFLRAPRGSIVFSTIIGLATQQIPSE